MMLPSYFKYTENFSILNTLQSPSGQYTEVLLYMFWTGIPGGSFLTSYHRKILNWLSLYCQNLVAVAIHRFLELRSQARACQGIGQGLPGHRPGPARACALAIQGRLSTIFTKFDSGSKISSPETNCALPKKVLWLRHRAQVFRYSYKGWTMLVWNRASGLGRISLQQHKVLPSPAFK